MPNLNQIFRRTIELIKALRDPTFRLKGIELFKDFLEVIRPLESEWTRRLAVSIAVRRAVTAAMTTHNLPGTSIAIAYRRKLVFSGAFGLADTSTNQAVTPTHLFRIASLAKPITSITVFRLIDAGKLQLGDHVFGTNGILGTTFGTQPYGPGIDQITVQHLLEHTTGWAKTQDPMFASVHMAKTQGQLITWMLDNEPLAKTPGTTFEYLNFGYLVLGRVIEQVMGGQSYASVVQNEVLAKCGISDMHIAGDTLALKRSNEVVYYSQSSANPYGIRVSRMDAHGGWIASPTDLLRILVRVDGLGLPQDILSSGSLATMFAPGVSPIDAKGWVVPTTGTHQHTGDLPGSAAFFQATGDGYCWAVLVNSRDDTNLNAMHVALADLLSTIRKDVKVWPTGTPL